MAKEQTYAERRDAIMDDGGDTAPAIPLKQNGVYLITGGAGGLGLMLAEQLAAAYQARLILVNRSALNEQQQQTIAALKQKGAELVFVQADISHENKVKKLLEEIDARYGGLNGIFHFAGVVHDIRITNKTMDQVSEVLAPKIAGTAYLDQATKDRPLDFFVMFSSLAALVGNAGQSDYAFANAFMDHYAHYRQSLQKQGLRSGHTLSINWPLWQEGGMQIDEQNRQFLLQTMGMKPLETEVGVNALMTGLSLDVSQFMVFQGDAGKLKRAMIAQKTQPVRGRQTLSPQSQAKARENIEEAVFQLASDILKVDSEEIDADEDMSDYGFDSITLTELTNRLNQQYRLDITPAILFEYPSLKSLIEFLGDSHPDRFVDDAVDTAVLEEEVKPLPAETPQLRSRYQSTAPVAAAKTVNEPVAVIGMAGVMPGSPDLPAFWQHLQAGDDLIDEVPADRWDWRAIYGDPATEPNKTRAKWGGFIDDIDRFDAAFFGISPREAELMDPQQRLFLQTAWHAIEDAGLKASTLSGSQTGLFVGVATKDYHELINQSGIAIEAHLPTGVAHSILANRISFLLDLHGPSEAIDTACSSSLAAIHRALTSLRNGECDLAIAGGVNVLLSKKITIAFSKAGMLSADGRCKTFDNSANGYVRGEGAGAIVLKPLSQAQADGDPIIAVIRGSAENHGGHASSLTAPNPSAQAAVIKKACEDAGISVETISYIEAHGTGTSLGDPIEINGLKKVFDALDKQPEGAGGHSCGLGSVKTNIGHLETAAGIAGVLKVLLSMQHRTLPQSLHFKQLNQHISLENTPFYIVDKTQPWTPLRDNKEQPRRAGVSSFGFGGSNAHVVLEEYPLERKPDDNNKQERIIVLSAKDNERLLDYVTRFISFLTHTEPLSLSAMAWTLQTGREAMNERIAVVVKTLDELLEKLRAFQEKGGKAGSIKNLYHGSVKQDKGRAQLLVDGEEGQAFIDLIIKQRKLDKLAGLWVTGLEFDWALLVPQQTPKRISLPVYPFAKTRHWLPQTGPAKKAEKSAQISKLHPLLERNTSTLQVQQFSTCFSDQAFYLNDHQVKQDKILPGAACIEMARAAGELAGITKVSGLSRIVWMQPIVVSGEKNIDISLTPAGQTVAYEISSVNEQQQRIVHGQGQLHGITGREVPTQSVGTRGVQSVDIKAIQQRCNNKLEKTPCYALFAQMGLHYGSSFQVISELVYNDNEVLASLQLPRHLSAEFSAYQLHPSILDGALQAVIGLVKAEQGTTYLPFSIAQISIRAPLTQRCYAYVRYRGIPQKRGLLHFDIQLLDETGKLLLEIEDFISRNSQQSKFSAPKSIASKPEIRPKQEASQAKALSKPENILYYQPEWRLADLHAAGKNAEPILLISHSEQLAQSLRQSAQVVWFAPGSKLTNINGCPSQVVYCLAQDDWDASMNVMDQAFKQVFEPLFELCQYLHQQKNKHFTLLLLGVFEQNSLAFCMARALSGFAKTLVLENPRFVCKTVLSDPVGLERLSALITAELSNADVEVYYSAGQRLVKGYKAIAWPGRAALQSGPHIEERGDNGALEYATPGGDPGRAALPSGP
ncbi:MAG: SDR family NAD(P)-dependent oxidoreductase, partial [Gammaproteobacteria bacterium]|nr:SDR family NAD(P)-dependent oxidoreductase [Gammaproteobacteria bacterium]